MTITYYQYWFDTNEYVEGPPMVVPDGTELADNGTLIEPPETGENEVACFDSETETWSIEGDFRGAYWDENANEFLNEGLNTPMPPGAITTPPPVELIKPFWNGDEWTESALFYKGTHVETKAEVDAITFIEISKLDEQKAKTLAIAALVASEVVGPAWGDFIVARDALVAEGNQFIIDNNLE